LKRKNKHIVKYILLFMALIIAMRFIIDITAKRIFPLKYKEYVIKYSIQNKIDPYLVFAVIKAESSFKPEAKSKKDARGLMQITEGTGAWGAAELKLESYSVESLFDPEINIRIGCWYLSRLMEEFNNEIDLVIAAYNGGSGNVSQWLKNREYSTSGKALDKIPFSETHTFLKRVKLYYSIYKTLYN
jgi:soluble lytic murein transglycosylase